MAAATRLTALAIAAVLATSAGAASARSAGVGFTFMPRHVLQGDTARIAVTVRPAGRTCTLTVRYHGGALQTGLAPVVAAAGRASWTWAVPTSVQAGVAQTTVRCARSGAVSRALVVVGRLVAPKITVNETGFSLRPSVGGGTRLSYGVILHADGPRDATGVVVQTNFVLADDHLLGTDSQRISGISGGSDYALGNTVSFPQGAPIVRLEVVVQVSSWVPHAMHLPTLANIHIVPSVLDPSWVGTIEGELQNTDPALTLQNAQLSAVVFDSAGNILGGGSGYAFQQLPPGAREFLQLSNGFDVIPSDKAATTMVSVVPTWSQLG